MTTTQSQNQEDPTPRTIFDYAREGQSFDDLPEPVKKHALREDKHKDARDAVAEIQTDLLFAEAAKVMRELLVSEEDKVRLGAASEIFRLRAVTLKANKKRQTAEETVKRLQDGFKFG